MASIKEPLTPLKTRKEISLVFSTIKRQIRNASGATTCTHRIGYPGGGGDARLIWLPHLRFWTCFKNLQSRHWVAYGLTDPRSTKAALNIRVETSIPHYGIDRRIAGILARDSRGTIYLMHSGKIAGGKKGVGKGLFWKRYRGEEAYVEFERGVERYALIAPIDAADFLERVGDFVHGVDAIRRGARRFEWKFPKDSATRPFTKKRGGTVEIEAPAAVGFREREHDDVLNALMRYISKQVPECEVHEDSQRDLHVVINGRAIDIELKTTSDRYAIYTAVGQLLLNRVRGKRTTLLLITPVEVSESAALLKRLQSLEICHGSYSAQGGRTSFHGLEAILRDLQRRPH